MVPVIIDSGAKVKVLDKTKCRLNALKNIIKLSDLRVKLYSYEAVTPFPVLGKFDVIVMVPIIFEPSAFHS